MEEYLNGQSDEQFQMPADIVTEDVCPYGQYTAGYMEYFIDGTQPDSCGSATTSYPTFTPAPTGAPTPTNQPNQPTATPAPQPTATPIQQLPPTPTSNLLPTTPNVPTVQINH